MERARAQRDERTALMEPKVIINFSELSENDHAYMYFLIMEAETRVTSKGANFISARISDGSDTIEAKIWNTDLDETPMPEGAVAYSRISASMYMGKLSYTLSRISLKPERDPEELLPTAPIDTDAAFDEIMAMAEPMRQPVRGIVEGLLAANKDAFKHAAAGRSKHHSYIGGLLYHSYRMAKAAEALCPIYAVDRDLVVAGCLLHDIGKLVEMDTDWKGSVEYTVKGSLLGHLAIGSMMVLEAAKAAGAADSEDSLLLAHIVASHHGKPEYGAVKEPLSREALLVHHLDVIDMEQEVIERNLPSLSASAGGMSPKFGIFYKGLYVPEGAHVEEENKTRVL